MKHLEGHFMEDMIDEVGGSCSYAEYILKKNYPIRQKDKKGEFKNEFKINSNESCELFNRDIFGNCSKEAEKETKENLFEQDFERDICSCNSNNGLFIHKEGWGQVKKSSHDSVDEWVDYAPTEYLVRLHNKKNGGI